MFSVMLIKILKEQLWFRERERELVKCLKAKNVSQIVLCCWLRFEKY